MSVLPLLGPGAAGSSNKQFPRTRPCKNTRTQSWRRSCIVLRPHAPRSRRANTEDRLSSLQNSFELAFLRRSPSARQASTGPRSLSRAVRQSFMIALAQRSELRYAYVQRRVMLTPYFLLFAKIDDPARAVIDFIRLVGSKIALSH